MSRNRRHGVVGTMVDEKNHLENALRAKKMDGFDDFMSIQHGEDDQGNSK